MNGKIMNSDAVIDRVSVSTEEEVEGVETQSTYVIHFKSTFESNGVPTCSMHRWSSAAGNGQAERVVISPHQLNDGTNVVNDGTNVEAIISLRSSLWSAADELRDQILFSVSCVP
jgi:hypothetical protein